MSRAGEIRIPREPGPNDSRSRRNAKTLGLVTAFLTACLAALALLATPAYAAARPTGCSVDLNGYGSARGYLGGRAYCSGGADTEIYRVRIYCSDSRAHYGVWRSPGGADSTKLCPYPHVVRNIQVGYLPGS